MPRSPSGPSRLSTYEDAWEAINRLIREGGSWSGFERNVFFLNAGDGTFVNASAASGLDFIDDGRAFAVLDLEGDGDPDLAVKNRSGPQVRILRNDLPPRGGRVSFRLRGKKANRDGVGARVSVWCGGVKRVESLKCGAGFLSQSAPWLHFAFPGKSVAERVEVAWPGGGRDEHRDLALDRRYRLVEGQAPEGEAFRAPSSGGEESEPAAETPPADASREAWLLAGLEPPDIPFRRIVPREGLSAVKPSDLRGREALIAFFSEECGLCAAEIAEWSAARRDIAASGAAVLLVRADPELEGSSPGGEVLRRALDLERESPRAFTVAAAGPRAVLAWGVVAHQALRWPVEMAVPMNVLLDQRGKVVKLRRGRLEWPRLARDLALLAQGARTERLGLPFPGVFYTGEPRRDPFHLGLGYMEAGLPDLAAGAFRRAIEIRPESTEALYNLGVVLGEEGGWTAAGEEDRGPLEEARRAFERAAALQPDFVDAHANLGVVLARLGDLEGAEARFAEALRIRPGHTEALLNLGSVRLARGDGEAALDAFRRAAQAEPDLPAARKRLAEALRGMGRRDEALAAFDEALALAPGDPEALSNRAVLLAESGRLDEAARDLETALKERPRHAAAWNNLGLVEDRRGRPEEARKAYRKSIEADPDLPEPRMNLARSHLRAGEREEAARVVRQLLEKRPEHAGGRELLHRIGMVK